MRGLGCVSGPLPQAGAAHRGEERGRRGSWDVWGGVGYERSEQGGQNMDLREEDALAD